MTWNWVFEERGLRRRDHGGWDMSRMSVLVCVQLVFETQPQPGATAPTPCLNLPPTTTTPTTSPTPFHQDEDRHFAVSQC